MPTPKLTDEQCVESLNLVEEYGSGHMAVLALGSKTALTRDTIERRAAQGRVRNLRPTFNRDAPRIYQRQRLGKMHLVIPDVQMKPGVRDDHLSWIGNYIVEKRPDVIVCIGDFADMPSLSVYDKGKLPFEGRRYVNDVKSVRRAMEKLLAPIDDYNRTAKERYAPRKVLTMGNHEHRIIRVVDENPEFQGKFDLDDLGYKDFGWEVHDYLEVVEIDGVQYSHFFTSGVRGNPVSSAAALLRERQTSATMGHVQYTDIAVHKKTQKIAMFCGTCYLHDEAYLSRQDNSQRRQIVVKHEVEDGLYDPMLVSLRFLEKAYG